jgi:hypothetical protein
VLKAGLVRDKSRLQKSRIAVTWPSANTWVHGSIYGNVAFAFSWKQHVAGKHFSWVEAISSYSPHAFRILLSDRELTSKHVRPYDPRTDKGPLRRRRGNWYWNGKFTSEFLIEGDISLADCIDFDFVSHHPQHCRPHGKACPELGSPPHTPGGRVLAFMLGNGLHAIDHVLRKGNAVSFVVEIGIGGILRGLSSKQQQFGGVIGSADFRKAVVLGALALYGSGQTEPAQELMALLKSRDTFDDALTDVVNEHFGITGWKIE